MNYKKYKKIKKELLFKIEKSERHTYELIEENDQELLYVVALLKKEECIEIRGPFDQNYKGRRFIKASLELLPKGFEFCYNQRPFKRFQNTIKENVTLFTLILFFIFSLVNIVIANDFLIWKFIINIFK
jgi:hypothetical protein